MPIDEGYIEFGFDKEVIPLLIHNASLTFCLFAISNGLFYHISLDQSISNIRGVTSSLGIPVFNANSVDPASGSTLFVNVPFMRR